MSPSPARLLVRIIPLSLLPLLGTSCATVTLNNSFGGYVDDDTAFTYSGALEAQFRICPGFTFGGGGRLSAVTSDDDDPHGLGYGLLSYTSWRMPGPRRFEFEATALLGGGWVPPGHDQEAVGAFLLGARFSLPIRVYPPPAPLWRLDRLTSLVFYLVPNLSYSAAYLQSPDSWRHELAVGFGLRVQLYSAVLP